MQSNSYSKTSDEKMKLLVSIEKARGIFYDGKDLVSKKLGYKMFHDCCMALIQLGKDHPPLKDAITEKLEKKFMPEVKFMKMELERIEIQSKNQKDQIEFAPKLEKKRSRTPEYDTQKIEDKRNSVTPKNNPTSNFPPTVTNLKREEVKIQENQAKIQPNHKKEEVKLQENRPDTQRTQIKPNKNQNNRNPPAQTVTNQNPTNLNNQNNPQLNVRSVKFSDIAGLQEAKQALEDAVLLPSKFSNLFVGPREPWKGILLYGPPGTGKTELARACANECGRYFLSLSASDILNKYIGESEQQNDFSNLKHRNVKKVFEEARKRAPAIIFIDEIDSLLSQRRSNESRADTGVKTEFFVQMDGVNENNGKLLVLAATNAPQNLDEAAIRRFEKRIYIPLPDKNARKELLERNLRDIPNSLKPSDFQTLAEKTEGFSGSDLKSLLKEASYLPLRRAQKATHFKITRQDEKGRYIYVACHANELSAIQMRFTDIPNDQLSVEDISMDHFLVALSSTKPSVDQNSLRNYENFTKSKGIQG